MALFSKEACCFCGKEVGLMSRSKLVSGDYICTDCKYLTHPFIRIDHLNKDQVEALMKEMEENEARFQSIEFRKTQRKHNNDTWIFYDNFDQGVFSLYTPETKKYKNHFVFNMTDVRPYDRLQEGSRAANTVRPQLTQQQYMDAITLTEKKDASGKPEGWVLKIPYFRKDMFIESKFPAAMKEDDVRYFHKTVQEIIARYNTAGTQAKRQLHEQNVYQTAGEIVKAAAAGKGMDGVEEAIGKSIQRSQDIDAGKIKKKGLLARLFGK